jgi:DNA-directed RNA polymerase subunit N (RpoN/RPB10)
MIMRNRIKCLKCGDIIESKYRWNMVWCSCKAVAVDGGQDYFRRVGNPEDYEELNDESE